MQWKRIPLATYLAPPGWSDSEWQTREQRPWHKYAAEAFLCDIGTDIPTVQPAPPRRFAQPKSDEDVERAKQAAIPVNTNIRNSH